MTVGILTVELSLPASTSLKAKRMVLHSVKQRLRNAFNVALAQVGHQDKWQRATLAVVGVEHDRATVNSVLSRVVTFLERFDQVQLIDYEMEMI